ncbi:MAG: hypothetical protein IH956_02345, partial [Chloroflexi bacterium]|nr:hypothetical protein [Chloroflexota bacterium]
MKRLAVLGSTGSIGTQTLDVVRSFPDDFRVIGLAARRSLELLEAQVREFRPKLVSCEGSVEEKAALVSNGCVDCSCGDGVCDPGEDQCNCPIDCGPPPFVETGFCADGIDNDCDLLIDCLDPDCALDVACVTGA